MKKVNALKIFFSCALGAGIGAMVALELNQYFWWIGILVGGLIGYLSYEFKAVIAAIGQTWRQLIAWRPDKELLKLRIRFCWWLSLAVIGMILIPVYLFCYSMIILFPSEEVVEIGGFISTCLIITAFFCFLLSIAALLDLYQKDMKKCIPFLRRANPIFVYFYWLPKGILWCLKKTPVVVPVIIRGIRKGFVIIGRFIKTVFILIHSEIRLLCGIDAAFGAGIGYFSGSVLIGMLIGGVVGVINYEVVSKRLLHLVPANSR